MNFEFDLRESVNENASIYFEKSKKLKGKFDGINLTVSKYEKELKELEKKEETALSLAAEEMDVKRRKKEWFEKFRWFYTSKGHLCIGGRDSGTNEVVIKKHTDKEDLVFHTDMAGSPFFVLKLGDDEVAESEIEEVASITACYSRAWKKGLSQTEVFYVNPEQVSKEANAGESLSKGSFMIRGKTNYAKHSMELLIGIDEDQRVLIGSGDSLKGKDLIAVVIQGGDKTSDVAKKIQHRFKKGILDEFVKNIPSGGAKVKEFRRV